MDNGKSACKIHEEESNTKCYQKGCPNSKSKKVFSSMAQSPRDSKTMYYSKIRKTPMQSASQVMHKNLTARMDGTSDKWQNYASNKDCMLLSGSNSNAESNYHTCDGPDGQPTSPSAANSIKRFHYTPKDRKLAKINGSHLAKTMEKTVSGDTRQTTRRSFRSDVGRSHESFKSLTTRHSARPNQKST